LTKLFDNLYFEREFHYVIYFKYQFDCLL